MTPWTPCAMPSERPASELSVRPATPADAEALGTLYLAARDAAYPRIPRPVHPPDEVRQWLRERVEEERPEVEVWLAEGPTGPAALLLLEDAWVHSLYVDPTLTGHGIGALLLELAKSLRPDGLGLWVFTSNEGARRFYRRHGFGEVRRTDGAGPDGNEEGEPDIELAWPDPDSIEGLRRRIDAVDDRLADLLGERAELTARIQPLKPVPGQAGRDRGREAGIVARMARRAPHLGPERLARIMETVIGESLDAADGPAAPPHGEPPR